MFSKVFITFLVVALSLVADADDVPAGRWDDFTCDQVRLGLYQDIVRERLGDPIKLRQKSGRIPTTKKRREQGISWTEFGSRKVTYIIWSYQYDDGNLLIDCDIYFLDGRVSNKSIYKWDREKASVKQKQQAVQPETPNSIPSFKPFKLP
jgi:hypothetical protein